MQCDFSRVQALLAEERCNVQVDSRKVQPGDVFVAVPGEKEDGTKYIPQALSAKAQYLVVAKEALIPCEIPSDRSLVVVSDVREAVGQLAAARYHTQNLSLTLLGITGTNGKTTCAALCEHLLQAMGHKVGVLGTINYRYPGYCEDAPLTTPDPIRLHQLLASMEKAGCSYCVMEVSSHSLAQKRVGGLPFDAAALTNVTQDHLDFHKTMEAYFACKEKLFTELPKSDKACVLNYDDPYGRRLFDLCPKALAFGFSKKDLPDGSLFGTLERKDIHGLRLCMDYQGKHWSLASPLLGAFNAANLLTVQALFLALGFDPSTFSALEDFHGVCGRLERVPCGSRHVFVDYAHTPDALVNVLHAVRDAGFTRIITVFGCGGNRDKTKRPLMGEAVARYSDVAIVTSDNPRFEDPAAIIEDIVPGLAQAKERYIEVDRKKATHMALDMATGSHDCVVIAGKGHENYQIIQGVRTHYSDQEVVQEYATCV